MTRALYLMLALSMAFPLASCGYKGKLKTPTQIEEAGQKKAREQEKRRVRDEKSAARKAKQQQEQGETPAPAGQ